MDERNVSFFRFEDLRIYAKAVDYSKWVLTMMQHQSSEAEKNLFISFCRSAYDIVLNIAEGSSRNKAQFEHHMRVAKTAIRECLVFTTIAREMGFIDDEQQEQSRNILMDLTRMSGALILSLQKGSHRSQGDAYQSSDDMSFDDDMTAPTGIPDFEN